MRDIPLLLSTTADSRPAAVTRVPGPVGESVRDDIVGPVDSPLASSTWQYVGSPTLRHRAAIGISVAF